MSILYVVVVAGPSSWTVVRVCRLSHRRHPIINSIRIKLFNTIFRSPRQQVSNGHWFDPGRTLLEASLAQW